MIKQAVYYLQARFFAGERGQDLIEYSLFGGLIAAALVAAAMLGMTTGVLDMSAGIGECIDWDGVACNP
jgi:Flp pilus assembly pilin Flp